MSKVEHSGSGALALQQPGPGAGSAAAAAAAANGNGGSHSSSKREKTPGSGMSPCAACKLLRRRCAKECVFAPYFPPDEPQKFANVHKVFGASNVNKMLQDLPLHQRSDAVGSMVYEADSRVRDPVYGCVGLISALQQQVASLQQQVASAQAEIVCLRMQAAVASNVVSMKAGMGMGVLGLQGSSGGSSSMGASHSSITSHSSMGTSHPSHHSPHHSHSHSHSHPSPHHSHHSPHQSSHQSHTPHHSPPLQPESPELHHQYKPAGMLMGIDTLDIGQAMWA